MSDKFIQLKNISEIKEVEELKKNTIKVLNKCEHATKIWNRSRSGMMLRNMIVGGEYSSLRQMRQVAAEIKSKSAAMIETKYKFLKKKKEAQLKLQEAEEEANSLKREYLELEAEELEKISEMIELPYIGAMREVIELSRLHDALEEKIRKEHGKFDEEVFEKEESRYWVRRSFSQSLRDIRQFGRITVGNQEVLEQIGFDPVVIQTMLIEFLEENKEKKDVSGEYILIFLNECAEKFCEVSAERMKFLGLPCDVEKSHLLLE